jgi:hypothetical protein
MASWRKYRSPRGFRDGGAVTPEVGADVPSPPAAPPETPEAIDVPPPVEAHADGGSVTEAPAPVPSPADDDAVTRALQASIRAEEMQRQARAPQTIDEQIDRMPISDHKKNLLRQYPMLMNAEIVPIAREVYQRAVSAGIDDDTEHMDRWLVDGTRQEIEERRQRMAKSAADAVSVMPQMQEPPIEKMADRLDQQAEAIRLAMDAANTTPVTIAAEIAPAVPPRKRSLPVSAPVARDVPGLDGKRVEDFRTITLSPEQRIVARNSFGPIRDAHGNLVDLSNDAKERMYAANLAKMRRLRASGDLNE